MENEEKYIREKLGQNNPFRVPEGYFDQLTERVMAQLSEQVTAELSEQVTAQLPERRQKSRFVALRPWLYAAACIVVLLVLSVTFLFQRPADDTQQVAANTVESTYMDEAADYAMLDNAEIYACLSEN